MPDVAADMSTPNEGIVKARQRRAKRKNDGILKGEYDFKHNSASYDKDKIFVQTGDELNLN